MRSVYDAINPPFKTLSPDGEPYYTGENKKEQN